MQTKLMYFTFLLLILCLVRFITHMDIHIFFAIMSLYRLVIYLCNYEVSLDTLPQYV